MALVRCVVSNAPIDCENGLTANFLLPFPVTAARLLENLPFEGEFAIRYRVSGDKLRLPPSVEYVWMDTHNAPNAELPTDDDHGVEVIDIMAVVIRLPSRGEEDVEDFMAESLDLYIQYGGEEKYMKYLNEVGRQMPLDNRPQRRPLDERAFDERNIGSGKRGFSLDKLGKGVGNLVKKGTKSLSNMKEKTDIAAVGASIWDGVASAAAGVSNLLGGGVSVLSDESMENLSNLSDHLDTKWNDAETGDVAILRDLWTACFNNSHTGDTTPYARHSDKWKEMGFQKNDPALDLKNSGSLALRGMLHLATNYKARTQNMLENNKQNLKSKYPFAIVGVNVTLLLADVLKLASMGFLGIRANYWELFEDEEAFFEMFSYCFMAMDTIWRQRGAVRADFGKITGEIKEKMKTILKRGPKTIREFKLVAVDENFVSSG